MLFDIASFRMSIFQILGHILDIVIIGGGDVLSLLKHMSKSVLKYLYISMKICLDKMHSINPVNFNKTCKPTV